MKLNEIKQAAQAKHGLKITVSYADYPSIPNSEQSFIKRVIKTVTKDYKGVKIVNPQFGEFEVFIPNVTKDAGGKFITDYNDELAMHTDSPLEWAIEYEEVSL